MKHGYSNRQVAGFLFTGILGTLFHFLFDWTNGNILAALFSAVNESIWEHMKLLFYPMFLFAGIERRCLGAEYNHFWCNKWRSILLGLVLIPVLYYTYTGILGLSADWFNITIFFIAAGVAFWAEGRGERVCPLGPKAALALLWMVAAVFTVLTFLPPRLPIFRDPLTGTYGFWEFH